MAAGRILPVVLLCGIAGLYLGVLLLGVPGKIQVVAMLRWETRAWADAVGFGYGVAVLVAAALSVATWREPWRYRWLYLVHVVLVLATLLAIGAALVAGDAPRRWEWYIGEGVTVLAAALLVLRAVVGQPPSEMR